MTRYTNKKSLWKTLGSTVSLLAAASAIGFATPSQAYAQTATQTDPKASVVTANSSQSFEEALRASARLSCADNKGITIMPLNTDEAQACTSRYRVEFDRVQIEEANLSLITESQDTIPWSVLRIPRNKPPTGWHNQDILSRFARSVDPVTDEDKPIPNYLHKNVLRGEIPVLSNNKDDYVEVKGFIIEPKGELEWPIFELNLGVQKTGNKGFVSLDQAIDIYSQRHPGQADFTIQGALQQLSLKDGETNPSYCDCGDIGLQIPVHQLQILTNTVTVQAPTPAPEIKYVDVERLVDVEIPMIPLTSSYKHATFGLASKAINKLAITPQVQEFGVNYVRDEIDEPTIALTTDMGYSSRSGMGHFNGAYAREEDPCGCEGGFSEVDATGSLVKRFEDSALGVGIHANLLHENSDIDVYDLTGAFVGVGPTLSALGNDMHASASLLGGYGWNKTPTLGSMNGLAVGANANVFSDRIGAFGSYSVTLTDGESHVTDASNPHLYSAGVMLRNLDEIGREVNNNFTIDLGLGVRGMRNVNGITQVQDDGIMTPTISQFRSTPYFVTLRVGFDDPITSWIKK